MSLGVLAAVLSVAASCPLEQAHYELKGAPGLTAGFERREPTKDWPTRVFFYVKSDKSGHTWWFLPYSGNGQGVSARLASTSDIKAVGWSPPGLDDGKARPLGDLDYLAADDSYRIDQSFRMEAAGAAPPHILLPGLQGALWYRPEGERESVPISFFDLKSCDAHP